MTSLKEVNLGHNQFCGPAVLSILTGKSTDECAYAIGRIRNNYNVKGVTNNDLLAAANNLGFYTDRVVVSGRSLYMALVQLSTNGDGIYIVMVPKHFVCIEVKDKQIYFCDNHTKEPIKAASSARLHQVVESIYKVTRKPKPPKIEFACTEIKIFECYYCRTTAYTKEDLENSLYLHRLDCKYKVGKEANAID